MSVAYEIVIYPEAREWIQALPSELLKELAEAVSMLELTPWGSDPITEAYPDGPVRPDGGVVRLTGDPCSTK